jgi:uncharacterized Ntn-hydrolase superfamily protein
MLFVWVVFLLVVLCTQSGHATFSIVAVDTVNNIVGSAGASCIAGAQIIEGVVEGVGAINTQALYNAQNQARADSMMQAGDPPDSIISFIVSNDAQNDGFDQRDRQMGAVSLSGPGASAAHTGSLNGFWAGSRTGPGYAIQGNILIDSTVVEMMQSAFESTVGPLEDRLMAALQAAKIQGADVRCFNQNKSSISAYIKVVRPGDGPLPFLDLVVPTTTGSTDPIDVLQGEFDAWRAAQVADPDLSTIAAVPGGLPHLGTDSSVITVTALNSSAEPPSLGSQVSLSHSGGGSLSAVTNQGGGVFTAFLIAGTSVETDTIRAFIAGGEQTVEVSIPGHVFYFLCGDVNEEGVITSADIIWMVNHLFKSGPAPLPVPESGDVDGSGALTSGDIIFLVNFVFKSGTTPCQ